MTKAAPEWTDARLNDLAAALQDVPKELAVLTTSVDYLAKENRALRTELSAIQLQLVQISWGLVVALIGASTAIIAALV